MSDTDPRLEPLLLLTRRVKTIEAYVLWHKDGAWSDANGDLLETDEIVFYAEGLLMEGFGMAWDHLTDAALGDHIRLCFWQGPPPPLPEVPPGATRLAGGISLG
jgi:hypothetical protein